MAQGVVHEHPPPHAWSSSLPFLSHSYPMACNKRMSSCVRSQNDWQDWQDLEFQGGSFEPPPPSYSPLMFPIASKRRGAERSFDGGFHLRIFSVRGSFSGVVMLPLMCATTLYAGYGVTTLWDGRPSPDLHIYGPRGSCSLVGGFH